MYHDVSIKILHLSKATIGSKGVHIDRFQSTVLDCSI